jgi:tRNA-binding protein
MNSLLKEIISFEDFTKVDVRIGTIIEITDFSKARIPAYQLLIDFGELGIKKSSAQITKLYTKDDLIQKQVIAVVNFKPKQIANFKSECLVLGLQDNMEVVLLRTVDKVNNGTKIS